MENVRYLFNRFVAITKDHAPDLIEKIFTPEMEQQLRFILKSSTFSEKISNVFPNSDRLDYEWLFDRMILKLRAMKRDQQHHTETTTSEPTTTLEMHSTTDNKCTWGPILCSINRVSFQRKVEVSKRIGEVAIGAAPKVTTHRPGVVPQWIRSIKTKHRKDHIDHSPNTSASVTHQIHLPKLFRRFSFHQAS